VDRSLNSLHDALPLSEVLKIVKGLTYTLNLSVHALILSQTPPRAYKTVATLASSEQPLTQTAPAHVSIHDVAYNACERDWSRGGASGIGNRGPGVRDALVKMLFDKNDEVVEKMARNALEGDDDDGGVGFTAKCCLLALCRTFSSSSEDDEGPLDKGKIREAVGRIVDVLVLDKEGCYRLDASFVERMYEEVLDAAASCTQSK
jgi:hypothetical protein